MAAAYQLVSPGARLDWRFDWSDWLKDDTIASHSWTITPLNGTSPETPVLHGETSPVVIAEGFQLGRVYHLTNSVLTNAGYRAQRTVVVRCEVL